MTNHQWRVMAKTAGGHVVLLAERLAEDEARAMHADSCDALLHISKYGTDNADHILSGPIGAVRLDAVEAVSINEDRSAGRR